jgi:hypothetical protein
MYIGEQPLIIPGSGFAEAAPVPVKPPLQPWDAFVRRAIDVVARHKQFGVPLSADQVRRLTCLMTGTLNPQFDARFVNYWDLFAYGRLGVGNEPAWDMILKKPADFVEFARRPNADDRFVLSALTSMDDAIWKAIKWLDIQYHTQGEAISRKMLRVKDWVAGQQRKPNNAYSCYR